MKRTVLRMILFAGLGLMTALAGCTDTDVQDAPPAVVPVHITHVNVSVPRSLEVSEANLYYPGGDIVWRGDPHGDRHAQVEAIFEDAMAKGVRSLREGRPATLDVEVTRFHALTEKARYTVGGVHAITFAVRLRDPHSKADIRPPRLVRADLQALGGENAIAADMQGETQKVRITRHLAEVIRIELTRPGGYENKRLGLIQSLNRAN